MAKEINYWTILVIGLLAYAFIPPVQTFVNGIFSKVGGGSAASASGTGVSVNGGASAGAVAPSGGVVTICDPSAKVTMSLNSHDAYATNSEAANGSHRVFMSTPGQTSKGDRGFFADGSTLTVSPKQHYKVFFGLNSTSSYPTIAEGDVPCSGTLDLDAGLATIDNALTFTAWNQNGQPLTASVTQDMSLSTSYTLPFKIQASSKKAFGDVETPGKGNILCLIYNRTAFSRVRVDGANSAYQPTSVSTGSVNTTSCYYIPVIQNDGGTADGTVIKAKTADSAGVVDGYYSGNFVVDTSSTFVNANPGHNLTFVVDDTSVDLNADNLDTIFGVQDESNNNLGTDVVQTGTIYIS